MALSPRFVHDPYHARAQDFNVLAEELLAEAVTTEQAVYELQLDDDPAALRAHIRLLARYRGVKIRTGTVADTVVVILVDAALWSQPAQVMRDKLSIPQAHRVPRR